MRLKLLTDRVASVGFQQAGSLIEVPDDEAKRMIAAGQAERVIETATVAASRTAAVRSKRNV